MTKREQILQQAQVMVKGIDLEKLIEVYEHSETQPGSEEVYIVRGWLLDELEKRDPEAFDRWMGSDDFPEDSPRSYFIPDEPYIPHGCGLSV